MRGNKGSNQGNKAGHHGRKPPHAAPPKRPDRLNGRGNRFRELDPGNTGDDQSRCPPSTH